MPGALQTLLAQVNDRIIFQYANTNRQLAFSYPITLINDTSAPQISGVTARAAHNSVTIAWTTDEYATSTVAYGTQRGIYPHTASDVLYARQHEIVLTDLPSGTVYYFKVRGVDRSGNASESAEFHFRTSHPAYLPMVLRRR